MGHRTKPTLGLIGFGAFGKLMARELNALFDIRVCDPAYVGALLEDGRALAVVELSEIARCDVIVLSVPVARMEYLCTQIAPYLRPGCLVVDVSSVKVAPMQVMARCLPAAVDIVGTHPLFGPQSADGGVVGRKIAVCPLRGPRWRVVAGFLRRIGLQVVVTTPEAHDKEAATVQGLTHLIAKVLSDIGPLPDQMTTASFDLLKQAVEMVKNDPPTVLHAIETANPYAAEVRGAFFDRAAELRIQFDKQA
ncbi:prephenate dehydrogenase [Shimia sp.]|uniref:prephenate dehydrogenase n=1 Tax=Shimia sp. TaxID=1954381 RepID=UPI003299E979